jgi:hypothetical protein
MGLRTWLILFAVLGLAMANWLWTMEFFWYAGLGLFWPILVIIAAIGYGLGVRLARRMGCGPTWKAERFMATALLIALLLLVVMCLTHRHHFYFTYWKRSWFTFPSINQAVWAYHGWLDRQFPAEAGSFKIHGERDKVLWTFHALSWLATYIAAVTTGFVCRFDLLQFGRRLFTEIRSRVT